MFLACRSFSFSLKQLAVLSSRQTGPATWCPLGLPCPRCRGGLHQMRPCDGGLDDALGARKVNLGDTDSGLSLEAPKI